MRGKRGELSIANNIIMGGIWALLVIGIILLATKSYAAIISPAGPSDLCMNSQWWDNDRGVKSILKSLEKDETSGEILFFNDNCNVVSFSMSQGINSIPYPGVQPRAPSLCLCYVDRSIISGDVTCEPHSCYTFSKFDRINDKQFSTEDLDDYVYLRFIKDGRTLRVEAVGQQKPSAPLQYTSPTTENALDPTGLLNQLVVIFKTPQIKAFTPILKEKQTGFLLPAQIPNVQGFTTFFDLDLAKPMLPGQSIDDYYNTHENIDPNLVTNALIEFKIPLEKTRGLTPYQKNNLALYYEKDNTWKISPLSCSEQPEGFICGARLTEFSSSFAISTIRLVESYASDTEEEGKYSLFIQEKSLAAGLDPLFVKAIITIESDWNTGSISRCGAAGIIQIMPHTARDAGLTNLQDPVNGVVYDTKATCTANEPYGTALRQWRDSTPREQWGALDDRFDDKKAIAAAIQYFLRIKRYLDRHNIPATNQNMAAGYQAGPGNVLGDGEYRYGNAYKYVTMFDKAYGKLQSSTFVVSVDRVWPVDNPVISSCYGTRTLNQGEDWHDGVDFRTDVGTNVKASANGIVHRVCNDENCNTVSDSSCQRNCGGYGNNIILRHEDRSFTRYSHLSEVLVSEGNSVNMGQVIAKSGNTGFSFAPHLDFKVYFAEDFSPDVEKPNYRRDPLNYLPPMNSYRLSERAQSCETSPTILALKDQGITLQVIA